METLKNLIYKPLNIYKNKYILRITIYSCLFLFLVLSSANILYAFLPQVFENNIYLYNILKDSIYQVLVFSSVGYMLSKYKFCYWSVLSFYGIFYIKIVWFIDSYIFKLPDFINTISTFILLILVMMIIYFITNTKN